MPTVREEITVFGIDAVKKAKKNGFTSSEFPVDVYVAFLKFDFLDSKNDPLCAIIKSWVSKEGIRHMSYLTSCYTGEELRDADWVCINLRAKNVIGSDASKRVFIPGKCQVCGSLNRFEGPVCPVEPPSNGQLIVSTNAGEWLIRKDCCPEYSSRLGPIKGEEWQGWGEIQLESVPYPLGSKSAGLIRETPCGGCEREGYYLDCENLLRMVYSEWPVNKNKSGFFGSYELMGNSIVDKNVIAIASPILYVPGKLAARLQKQVGVDFSVLEFDSHDDCVGMS